MSGLMKHIKRLVVGTLICSGLFGFVLLLAFIFKGNPDVVAWGLIVLLAYAVGGAYFSLREGI